MLSLIKKKKFSTVDKLFVASMLLQTVGCISALYVHEQGKYNFMLT